MSEVNLFASDEESLILYESLPQSSGFRNNYSPIPLHYLMGVLAQTNGSLHAKMQRPVTTSKTSAIDLLPCISLLRPIQSLLSYRNGQQGSRAPSSSLGQCRLFPQGNGPSSSTRPPQQAFSKPEPRRSADSVPSQLTLSTPSVQLRKMQSLNPSRILSLIEFSQSFHLDQC
ncbi:hypothetical protein DPX16_2328 [Anabarilius grahami]|uniref:Uncharacterized protein n=1 Tax=Anabarilius grahami TaxID=495550 RepID=A0A3N0Z3H1_ANAGA|nr:hypothetical protein DPX16_2328 [Anabarilius grahami]